jgi:hypothetical protein
MSQEQVTNKNKMTFSHGARSKAKELLLLGFLL